MPAPERFENPGILTTCPGRRTCAGDGDRMYEPRTYRTRVEPSGLVGFRVVEGETDLLVHAERDLSELARDVVRQVRSELERYISAHPRFAESFVPIDVDRAAPPIVAEMEAAARAAGVGPMAAVAGAIAEAVVRSLLPRSAEVIVENGGDVFLAGRRPRVVGVWAGRAAPRLGLEIGASDLPCAVATSSATIGHSVSLGAADAVTVVARSGALADAAASAIGNRVHSAEDIPEALAAGTRITGVRGVAIVADGSVALAGDLTLVPLAPGAL